MELKALQEPGTQEQPLLAKLITLARPQNA